MALHDRQKRHCESHRLARFSHFLLQPHTTACTSRVTYDEAQHGLLEDGYDELPEVPAEAPKARPKEHSLVQHVVQGCALQ